MFTSGGPGGYVSEKAESETGWLFPVGDEVSELGYYDMFTDMFNCIEGGKAPMETFYDGYIVNEIMDAALRSAKSKKWEPIDLKVWRGGGSKSSEALKGQDSDEQYIFIKEEKLPNGQTKVILKDKKTGQIIQQVKE